MKEIEQYKEEIINFFQSDKEFIRNNMDILDGILADIYNLPLKKRKNETMKEIIKKFLCKIGLHNWFLCELRYFELGELRIYKCSKCMKSKEEEILIK